MESNILTVNNILIAATCLLSWIGMKDNMFSAKYIFSIHRVLSSKEYYRFITSGFFHADYLHLIFSMIFLLLIGDDVEKIAGPVNYLIIYAAGIIGGNVLSLIVNKNKNMFHTVYGSSGGVSSILFAAVLLMPGGNIMLLPIPLPIPFWLYAVLYLGGAAYAFKKNRNEIGIDAHFGGAFIGLITVAILRPSVLEQSPILFTVLFFMSLGLFVFMVYGKGPLAMEFKMRKPLPKQTPMSTRYGNEGEKKYTVDGLLDKIAQKGIKSLTPDEKAFLEKHSKRKR